MKIIFFTTRYSFFNMHWQNVIKNLDIDGNELVFVSQFDLKKVNLDIKYHLSNESSHIEYLYKSVLNH